MNEREKLIEILLKIYEENAHFVFCFTEDEAAVVADNLLANGVSVPSCKVGDIVYQLDSAGDIYKSAVTQRVLLLMREQSGNLCFLPVRKRRRRLQRGAKDEQNHYK